MSEFDKEAERERLREQYEAERADREATQRMSELLLQGATMTNRHCDTCGDPIFRYEGREFCVTCEAEGRSGGQETADPGDQGATQPEPGPTEGDARSEPEPVDTEADEASSDADTTGDLQSADGAKPKPSAEPSGDRTVETSGTAEPTATTPSPSAAPHTDGDLASARAAMVRTVTELAERAEETGDVGRKRTLLAAVREAAEAVAAIDDADR